MSADGSSNFAPTATIGSPTPTLADVIRHLEQDPGLDPRQRREMFSAIRTVCRVLNLDSTSAPANPASLRMLLHRITAAAAGVSPGRWANVLSLLWRALKSANIPTMPGRYRDPLAPEWEALRALLPDRHSKSGLSSFMGYCTVRFIAPTEVTAETFVQFGTALVQTSRKRDPGGVYRDSCKLWNWAAERVPGWLSLQVGVPNRSRRFALRLDAFPQSFQADVNRFLSDRANPDVFSDDYHKPVRPSTNRGRRQKIFMAATALVKTGFPVEKITGLEILVELDNAKTALRFLLHRAGGKKTGYIHHIATLLKSVATHHAHKDEKTLAGLREMCRRLNPGKGGLTEKNKACLRQFADPRKLADLLMLPRDLLSEADRAHEGPRQQAVRVALGLAIGIELVLPLRAHNLGGLRLDRHIHRAGKSVILSVTAEETKNGNAIEGELPSWLIQLLDIYLKRLTQSQPSPTDRSLSWSPKRRPSNPPSSTASMSTTCLR